MTENYDLDVPVPVAMLQARRLAPGQSAPPSREFADIKVSVNIKGDAEALASVRVSVNVCTQQFGFVFKLSSGQVFVLDCTELVTEAGIKAVAASTR